MLTFVGLGPILRAGFWQPFDRVLVFWMGVLARIRTLFRPKILYKPLGPNELRLLRLHPPLTNRSDEPVRCSLDHVSLDHNTEYKAWAKQADTKLRLYRKTRAWMAHCADKFNKNGEKYWHERRRYTWGDYMALSYLWGSSECKRRIILNGQFVSVNENLEAALRSSQSVLTIEGSIIRLWVDALCVNQDDIAERGREVRRMRKIYGDSMGIFAHVGVESDDSDLAMGSIAQVAQNLLEGHDYRSMFITMASQVAEGQPHESHAAFVALFKLFCRPYWSRMWIIQELAMGENQLVCCGNRWASLRDVRQVLKLLVFEAGSLSLIIPKDTMDTLGEAYQGTVALLWWIGRVRELILEPEGEDTLKYTELRSPILSLAQYSFATDPRDKVYGLLGLLPKKLAAMVDRGEQNYVLTTEVVFLNFSKAIIEVTEELDVIYAQSLKQKVLSKLGLPSWATDWTMRQERTSGVNNSCEWYFGCEEGYETAAVPEKYVKDWTNEANSARSDGDRKAQIKFSSDDKLLFCEGFCIGEIEGVAPEVTSLIGAISAEPDSIVQPKTSPTPYGAGPETAQALLRTLLLDPFGDQTKESILFQIPWFGAEADVDAENGTFNLFGEGADYFDKMRRKGWKTIQLGGNFFQFELIRRRIGRFQVGNRLFKDYFPLDIPTGPEKIDATIFNVLTANMIGRRLVTTLTGHIGLAPATTIPGDLIYVLLGSSMPVILRSDVKSGHYEVVAECYLDGFMKGEAIEGLDAGQYQLQEITLC